MEIDPKTLAKELAKELKQELGDITVTFHVEFSGRKEKPSTTKSDQKPREQKASEPILAPPPQMPRPEIQEENDDEFTTEKVTSILNQGSENSIDPHTICMRLGVPANEENEGHVAGLLYNAWKKGLIEKVDKHQWFYKK